MGTVIGAVVEQPLQRSVCYEPDTAADPLHTNKAEDMSPIVHTRTLAWERCLTHVAGKQQSQDGNSLRLDFKACACLLAHTLPPSIPFSWFYSCPHPTIRSRSASLQFILTSKAHLPKFLQRSLYLGRAAHA